MQRGCFGLQRGCFGLQRGCLREGRRARERGGAHQQRDDERGDKVDQNQQGVAVPVGYERRLPMLSALLTYSAL